MTTLIGVAGGSGSGKTTVARTLLAGLDGDGLALLMQDAYYRDLPSHAPEFILGYNFDHPDSLELSLLAQHLAELKAGRAVDVPIYDFATHTRTERTQRVEPGPVIMVEGILLFALPELRAQFDLSVFVDTDADVRLARRVRRDVAERGRSWDDVLRQWEQTVRPMHQEFVEPSRRWADVIVPEGGMNRAAMAMLQDHLEQLLRS
ncbi:MAG: uridine kinase [Planctomycetota bacterium]|nr:MAG: uridine kinase [Planctomycetota bacterium]